MWRMLITITLGAIVAAALLLWLDSRDRRHRERRG